MQAWSECVTLRHATTQPRPVRLREPRGADELALAGVDTHAGAQWLDAMLDGAPCPAAELSASDRDALYAALHRALWGDRVVSSLRCAACGAMYDLSFEISTLQRRLRAAGCDAAVEAPRTLNDAEFGLRLRLPGAADEDAAAQHGPEAGRLQLATTIADGVDPQLLAQRLEAAAPLIDVDLDTVCAECGEPQAARFDIQSFVLQRVLDERETLLGEVHALASAYGWSLAEISGLPRSLRRTLAERLQGEPGGWAG